MRALSPEQLYESFIQATGYRDPQRGNRRNFFQGGLRQQFLSRFRQQGAETHVSLTQSLMLMNNPLVVSLTDPNQGEVLAGIVHAPFMTTADRIDALFLAALSRRPTPDESVRFRNYAGAGVTAKVQPACRSLASLVGAGNHLPIVLCNTALASEKLNAIGAAEIVRRKGLADIFWALLNSSEFMFNH